MRTARVVPHSRAALHGGSENLQVYTELGLVEGPRYACVSEHARCAGRRREVLLARACKKPRALCSCYLKLFYWSPPF